MAFVPGGGCGGVTMVYPSRYGRAGGRWCISQVIGVRSFECRLVFGLSVGGGGSSSSGVRPSGYR